MDAATPILKDKRLWLTAGTIGATLALTALHREPSAGALTMIGGLVTAFLAQSQWGQTKRTEILSNAAPTVTGNER